MAEHGEGEGPIFYDEVDCTGNEQRLMDCYFETTPDCGHHEDAAVNCFGKTIEYVLYIAST